MISFMKTLWGLLFRLFPCPKEVGLRSIGNPGRESPVLVTCNFDLTVKRLARRLRGVDAWLLVAESRGVNVWCAAGAEELSTRTVVSVLKTSDVADRVDHRTLVLPPLAAPGVRAGDVRARTGWAVRWGPVRAEDLPRYLAAGCRRDDETKRVTYDWRERLDTGLGSLFVFYLLGAFGFALFGRPLLANYLVVGAAAFLFFMLAAPWIPGKRGITKVLFLEAILAAGLIASDAFEIRTPPSLRADLIIAMVMLLFYGTELGGLASTMPSDLDPFLARLGVGAVGNAVMAGTVRTELLNGYRELTYHRDRCIGCTSCVEVCPLGVWELERKGDGGGLRRAVLAHPEACTACRACLTQCETGAIEVPRVNRTRAVSGREGNVNP